MGDPYLMHDLVFAIASAERKIPELRRKLAETESDLRNWKAMLRRLNEREKQRALQEVPIPSGPPEHPQGWGRDAELERASRIASGDDGNRGQD